MNFDPTTIYNFFANGWTFKPPVVKPEPAVQQQAPSKPVKESVPQVVEQKESDGIVSTVEQNQVGTSISSVTLPEKVESAVSLASEKNRQEAELVQQQVAQALLAMKEELPKIDKIEEAVKPEVSQPAVAKPEERKPVKATKEQKHKERAARRAAKKQKKAEQAAAKEAKRKSRHHRITH